MGSYDVAVWLHSENVWPQIILVVQADTAVNAVISVLHARQVRGAVKVATRSGDGRIHRWYDVTTLVDGFDSRYKTCLPMGMSRGDDVCEQKQEKEEHESEAVYH